MVQIELLAPAKNYDIGVAAINCGADAVYIGASQFGAREAASNSIGSIEKLAAYAHKYRGRVYAAVNTLLTDEDFPEALELINQLYLAGIDALIIQDVGLLECDLPPIPLFASTQMHNNTPQRVAFLEQVGFNRAILARELKLEEIMDIRRATNIELECFIHGALCVSYSGQCYMSYALGGRSGNRGQCAQPCRRLYSLVDNNGKVLEHDRHLLSLRDLSLTAYLRELITAGITSFKIEGRLKDRAYVMNVVGHYRTRLDELLIGMGLEHTSSGSVFLDFSPNLEKTFNRGYTQYFLHGRGVPLVSWDSPKSTGELLGKVTWINHDSMIINTPEEIHRGDGICFFDINHKLAGTLINDVQGNTIFPEKMDGLSIGTLIFRNHDHKFLEKLDKSKTERKIAVTLQLEETAVGLRLNAMDEDGNKVSKDMVYSKIPAQNEAQAVVIIQKQLSKMGDTIFFCKGVKINLSKMLFIQVSTLNSLRRDVLQALQTLVSGYRPEYSIQHIPNNFPFPEIQLSFTGNVLNSKAVDFYRRHGVSQIESAAESGMNMHGSKVMTTRYCIKFELGFCPKTSESSSFEEPLSLVDELLNQFPLYFNCNQCEMEIYLE